MKMLRAALAALLLVNAQAMAAVLIDEDFENYQLGSVAEQGGWTEWGPYAPPVVAKLPYLGSHGLTSPPGSASPAAIRGPGWILGNSLTLQFDAYFPSVAPPQSVSGIGFHGMYDGDFLNANPVGWFAHTSDTGKTELKFNYTLVAGGLDKPIRLRVVLDPIAKQWRGAYDFGDGWQTTEARYRDFRPTSVIAVSRYSESEIDNLSVVTGIPEPTTWALMGLGLMALYLCLRLRLQRARSTSNH